jgi:hypothetical protein
MEVIMYRTWMVIILISGLTLAACAGVDQLFPSAYPAPQFPDSPVVSEPGANPDGAHTATAYPAPAAWEPKPGDESMVRGQAFVEKTDILTLESFPPQFMLSLAGSLPTPCHELRVKVYEPNDNSEILVEVYSVVDPTAICAQVLVAFEQNIPLGSYPSGEYTVLVNGEPAGVIQP